MRCVLPNITALGLLSAYFLCGKSNPIIRNTECVDVGCKGNNQVTWAITTDFNITSPELTRRAGGGRRPDRLPENSPNGSPSTSNDPNDHSGAGDQTGETEGFEDVPDTSGNLGNPEGESNNSGGSSADPNPNAQAADPNSNAQPANPVTNAQPINNPATQNANQYPPSARNNQNRPASTQADGVTPPFDASKAGLTPININTRKTEFQTTITNNNLNGRPWFYFSGIGLLEQEAYKRSLDVHLKLPEDQKLVYMGDVCNPNEGGAYYQEAQAFKRSEMAERYYWAANSKALGQASGGHVYTVIPGGQHVNQPYPEPYKVSNWWTYELPELTRNPNVDSITVVPTAKSDLMMSLEPKDYIIFGSSVEIWRRGDEPIGFEADERYEATRPGEPWMEVPEVPIQD